MKQLDSVNFDLLIENTHYKNIKTEVIDDKTQKSPIEKIDYSKINCSTRDLLKEKDKKIESLQEQMLILQKKLEQQKPNNNNYYKSYNSNNSNSANNINYSNLNCNTSTNFPLKSEIKKIWEELALVSLLDNFIDYEKQPEKIFHFVSEIFLITDKLLSELCFNMYEKVSQSLNIINDKKFINDIEKTSRPLIKEHLNKTFAGTNNQQFIDKVIDLFKNSAKRIIGEGGQEFELGEVVGGEDFKFMIKKIKDILLFTKFNDQQLFFKIEKDFNKRIVEKIRIKNNIEKKNYLIINDNNQEEVDGVIILKPPVLRSGFPLNNDFKTIIILYEKENSSKSYKNFSNINNNNNQIENKKEKINKILGMKIKKISNFKNVNNNIEIKTDEYYNYNRANKKDINKKGIHNEEIINTVFSKNQRNSYQKLSKNMNLNNNKYKEKKYNFKTDFNVKDNNNQIQLKNREKNIIENDEKQNNNIIINSSNKPFKNINIYKKEENFSNDYHISEKRNIISNKNHRPQLSDQFLKNNSSKNLFDYMHRDLLNNSSSKKYQNVQKEANNSFNQNHFITYNNNEINNFINIKNYIGKEEEEENEQEITYINTAKGVYNLANNYKIKNMNYNNFDEDDLNDKNKKQRNTHNNENMNNLNQISFNQNEKNIIINNQGSPMNYNQFKEKIYTKNSLNKLNKNNLIKNIQNNNLNENKNYKKINSQKNANNNNIQKKKYIENNYKKNQIFGNNNEKQNKFKITAVDLYNNTNNNFMHSKFENNNLYIQNESRVNNYINNQYNQDSIIFKKNKTATIISNKKNNDLNIAKKIIHLIKMKTQQNQNNINNNNNTNNQNRRSSNRIKYNNNQQHFNNKIIQIENSNMISENYKKIIRNNKNINHFIMDSNNDDNFNSKKNLTVDNKNNIKPENNNKNYENEKKKKNILSSNKYNNSIFEKNKNIGINNNNNNLSKEKNIIKEINNNPGIRNNNLIENPFFDYNEINNTGYKIKNVNINYFNIMQPNKLYINQNSTRSKSRPSDCERNKILINYNHYNKNIIQNSNKNNNIKKNKL